MADEIPEAAITAVVDVLVRRWETIPAEYGVNRDVFADTAREVLAAALPHLDTRPTLTFHMRVVEKDTSGYYFPRWDKATPITVQAATKAEALEKCWAVMGDCPRGRGWTWMAMVDQITGAGT